MALNAMVGGAAAAPESHGDATGIQPVRSSHTLSTGLMMCCVSYCHGNAEGHHGPLRPSLPCPLHTALPVLPVPQHKLGGAVSKEVEGALTRLDQNKNKQISEVGPGLWLWSLGFRVRTTLASRGSVICVRHPGCSRVLQRHSIKKPGASGVCSQGSTLVATSEQEAHSCRP